MGLHAVRPRWRTYTPVLDVFSSGATSPNLGDGARTQTGRFLYLPDEHLCRVDFIVAYGNSGTGGAGTYIVSLPVPAQAALGGQSSGGYGTVQHDRPLGSAYVGRLFQGHGITVYPSLADTGPNSTTGELREKWVQFFSPWQIDAGTATITTAATTVAVTYAQTMVAAPTAEDITISWSSSATNDPGNWWLSSLTTTGFTMNVRNAPGSGGVSFRWKVRQETPVFVTDQSPWAWGALGDGIYASLCYETAAA